MTSEAAAATPGRRSKLKLALWIACVCCATVALFEATLRVIAYADVSWGKPLRKPQLYSDRWSDPLFFQLAQRWTHEPGALLEKVADPRLGWVNEDMDREAFSDPDEPSLNGRRPVLLFGDSYVRCMTDAQNCFEGWMERSSSGKTHKVFNYGVRAYGIDQIAMLARLTLPHWKGRNALVAIGIFVEDDLDRALLDYRGWPKPRFTLDADGNLVEPAAVPTPEQYDALHPVWKRSLAWGWLLYGSNWLPWGIQSRLAHTRQLEEEKQRLAGAILERLERDLQEARVEHFYVLFPSIRQCVSLEPADWRENFLLDWLDSHRLPYVNVKRDLLLAALEQRRHPSVFFGVRGALSEHLTPDGNEVAFRGLLRGIEGDYDVSGGQQPPHPFELHNLESPDERRMRFELGWSPRFPDAADRERLILVPSADHPVRVGCVFSRPARRFRTTARLVSLEGEGQSAPVKLELRLNRETVREIVLDGSKGSESIELDVFSAQNLEIVASRPDATNASGSAAVLSRPRFD